MILPISNFPRKIAPKMLTELRVVNEKSNRPSVNSLMIRSIARRIPFDSISFFSAQGWHDRLSETKVIQ